MDTTIEQSLGRRALIQASCNPRELMTTHNRAAKEHARSTGEKLPSWDERLIEALPE